MFLLSNSFLNGNKMLIHLKTFQVSKYKNFRKHKYKSNLSRQNVIHYHYSHKNDVLLTVKVSG
jgi:hypothetical protein